MSVSIFDYGAGNLRSVENTLDALGVRYELIRDATSIQKATKLILPGVGHFGQMMRALDAMQVRDALIDTIHRGIPFLGICLGLQALFTSSDEAPEEHGLNIFDGKVLRFSTQLRVPHMGWNHLQALRPSRLLNGLDSQPYLYFAHSYYAPVTNATSAVCEYAVPFTAVLEHKNVCGVQFHPEKSGELGLRIVKNFVERVC